MILLSKVIATHRYQPSDVNEFSRAKQLSLTMPDIRRSSRHTSSLMRAREPLLSPYCRTAAVLYCATRSTRLTRQDWRSRPAASLPEHTGCYPRQRHSQRRIKRWRGTQLANIMFCRKRCYSRTGGGRHRRRRISSTEQSSQKWSEHLHCVAGSAIDCWLWRSRVINGSAPWRL